MSSTVHTVTAKCSITFFIIKIRQILEKSIEHLIHLTMFRLPNKRQTNLILDKIHVGFVSLCMATTVLAAGMLGFRIYTLYSNEIPKLKQEAKEKFLAEGAHDRDPALELKD